MEGNGRGGGGGSEAAPSVEAFELADMTPLGVLALVEGATVGVEATAADALSPSLRSFTSDGSTNSAFKSRPPCGGH